MKIASSILAAIVLCLASFAQVSVAPSPVPHIQFLDRNGRPLSGGRVFTYQAGTTTAVATYKDGGGIAQNPAVITLDAGGYADIWLANQSYKFCVYSSTMVLQYSCIDNIQSYLGLLNTANTWSQTQTFSQAVKVTLGDNQFIIGNPGSQVTLDFPPPASPITLHFPNTGDTMVGRATTDNLTNKTLTSPTITNPTVNGCLIPGSAATYSCIPNASPTGTTLNLLVKLGNPLQATVPATTDISGVVGACVANCGTTGSAVIQTSGIVSCAFDNATTFRDLVIISTSVAGQCHDSGLLLATGATQIVGYVLSTNAGPGTFQVLLNLPIGVSEGQDVSLGTIAALAPDGHGPSITISPASATVAGANGGSIVLNPGLGAGGGSNGTVKVLTGMNAGNGFQHKRQASCVTGAGAGSTCNTTLAWSVTWADNNYTAVCTISGETGAVTGTPYVMNTSGKLLNQMTVTIVNLTAVASSGTLDCIGVHD